MITHVLADAAPTAAEWGGAWVVLTAAAFFAANIATVVLSLKSSRKREVSFSFEPASKKEFDKHVEENRREHENLFSKIGGVERGQLARMDALSKEWRSFVDSKFDDLVGASEDGREKLHSRINELLGEFRELRGEVRSIRDQRK